MVYSISGLAGFSTYRLLNPVRGLQGVYVSFLKFVLGLFVWTVVASGSEGMVDGQGRLRIGFLQFDPPDSQIDEGGQLVFGESVRPIPGGGLLKDGSLLLGSVVYSAPDPPVDGSPSYEDWLWRSYPDPADRANSLLVGPLSDPDASGVPNLVRYALAMNESRGRVERLPRLDRIDGRIAFRFPFIGVRDDVRVEVVVGADLVNWDLVLWDSWVDGNSEIPNSWVSVTDVLPLEPGGENRFFKLRVSMDD